MDKIFSIPPGDILLWFVVFLFSLSFHEAAHAWTSLRYGDDTGKLQGRITLNPLPHIDPFGTVLFPLVGMMAGGMMFGWAKPVMTNPLLWRDKKKANIMVSAAGPISNFILMTIAFILIKVLLVTNVMQLNFFNTGGPFNIIVPSAAESSSYLLPISTILSVFLTLNILLGIFNLLPIPPLDGSHVLESLLPPALAEGYEQIRPYGFLLLIALMYLGVFQYIINPVSQFIVSLLY